MQTDHHCPSPGLPPPHPQPGRSGEADRFAQLAPKRSPVGACFLSHSALAAHLACSLQDPCSSPPELGPCVQGRIQRKRRVRGWKQDVPPNSALPTTPDAAKLPTQSAGRGSLFNLGEEPSPDQARNLMPDIQTGMAASTRVESPPLT